MIHHLQRFEVVEDAGLDAAGGLFFNPCENSLYLPGRGPEGAQNQTLKLKR
jgi:hypothetical protein